MPKENDFFLCRRVSRVKVGGDGSHGGLASLVTYWIGWWKGWCGFCWTCTSDSYFKSLYSWWSFGRSEVKESSFVFLALNNQSFFIKEKEECHYHSHPHKAITFKIIFWPNCIYIFFLGQNSVISL